MGVTAGADGGKRCKRAVGIQTILVYLAISLTREQRLRENTEVFLYESAIDTVFLVTGAITQSAPVAVTIPPSDQPH